VDKHCRGLCAVLVVAMCRYGCNAAVAAAWQFIHC